MAAVAAVASVAFPGGALGCAGAAVGFAAAAGAGAAAGFASPAAALSTMTITLPSLTLSPNLTLSSLTTPATGEGTSIVALSDSSETSESSGFTVSPGLTKISMTGISLKSPMSGTLISTMLIYGP